MKALSLLSLLFFLVQAPSCKKDSSLNGAIIDSTSTITIPKFYISATMHIESAIGKWPNVDNLLSFFQIATQIGKTTNQTTGMRWSIGADIGWLQGELRAKEVILATESLGVEWDIHAHNMSDRPLCYNQIVALGGHPNKVCSGFQITEIDALRNTINNGSASWKASYLWGMTIKPDHTPGSENYSAGLWRPKSNTEYLIDDINATLIAVGGYTRTIADLETLANTINSQKSLPPVTSATIMIDPQTLKSPQNGIDGITELTAFANRVGALNCVKWASISKSGDAWIEAGSVYSKMD